MNTVEVAPGVYSFMHPNPTFGNSNIGLVIDPDGLTFIDSSATPAVAETVFSDVKHLTASLQTKLKRVLLTSSRVAFAGGSATFWKAAFYGSEATSEQLDLPANPEVFRTLLPDHADAYHDRFTTRPITHIAAESTQVSAAVQGLVMPGESSGNLIAYVESAGVVFAGALASFGVVPLGFDADILAWATSLEQLAELAPTIIPGHGPAGGTQDVVDLAAYLRACDAADGDSGRLQPGPWDTWSNQEFHSINIERAALLSKGDLSVPLSMYSLLGISPPPE